MGIKRKKRPAALVAKFPVKIVIQIWMVLYDKVIYADSFNKTLNAAFLIQKILNLKVYLTLIFAIADSYILREWCCLYQV